MSSRRNIPPMPLMAQIILFLLSMVVTNEPADADRPKGEATAIAQVFGEPIYSSDLDPGPATTSGAEVDSASFRKRRFQELVWSAIFENYAAKGNIKVTDEEIESLIHHTRKGVEKAQEEWKKQERRYREELESPSLTAERRAQINQHLEVIERLKQHEKTRRDADQDSTGRALRDESERTVAKHWVKRWKINQALYNEYGGRIIFQQAGWEPIDAYRKILDEYVSKREIVIRDPELRNAIYSYFDHKFVYADEENARFYFEKPYWERTDAELEAAGFK